MPENLSKTDLINQLVGARERGERPVAPDADLRGVNLRWADLRDADLRWVNLRGADLRDADLTGVNPRGANLTGANPRGARIIHLAGLPSGETIFMPTPGGWYLTVGCWEGNLEDFKTLIASDARWPEARGSEVGRRRPSLQAVVALCEAHMCLYPDIIEELAEKWQETDGLGVDRG